MGPREDVMLWQNWNPAFVRWKSNSEVSKAKHLMLIRHSKRLSAASRNYNSNKMKIRRTKIPCPNWPKTEKLNKSLKKLKIATKWLKLNLQSVNSNLKTTQDKSASLIFTNNWLSQRLTRFKATKSSFGNRPPFVVNC